MPTPRQRSRSTSPDTNLTGGASRRSRSGSESDSCTPPPPPTRPSVIKRKQRAKSLSRTQTKAAHPTRPQSSPPSSRARLPESKRQEFMRSLMRKSAEIKNRRQEQHSHATTESDAEKGDLSVAVQPSPKTDSGSTEASPPLTPARTHVNMDTALARARAPKTNLGSDSEGSQTSGDAPAKGGARKPDLPVVRTLSFDDSDSSLEEGTTPRPPAYQTQPANSQKQHQRLALSTVSNREGEGKRGGYDGLNSPTHADESKTSEGDAPTPRAEGGAEKPSTRALSSKEIKERIPSDSNHQKMLEGLMKNTAKSFKINPKSADCPTQIRNQLFPGEDLACLTTLLANTSEKSNPDCQVIMRLLMLAQDCKLLAALEKLVKEINTGKLAEVLTSNTQPGLFVQESFSLKAARLIEKQFELTTAAKRASVKSKRQSARQTLSLNCHTAVGLKALLKDAHDSFYPVLQSALKHPAFNSVLGSGQSGIRQALQHTRLRTSSKRQPFEVETNAAPKSTANLPLDDIQLPENIGQLGNSLEIIRDRRPTTERLDRSDKDVIFRQVAHFTQNIDRANLANAIGLINSTLTVVNDEKNDYLIRQHRIKKGSTEKTRTQKKIDAALVNVLKESLEHNAYNQTGVNPTQLAGYLETIRTMLPTINDLSKERRDVVASLVIQTIDSIDVENKNLAEIITCANSIMSQVISEDNHYLFCEHRNQNVPEGVKTRTHKRIEAAITALFKRSLAQDDAHDSNTRKVITADQLPNAIEAMKHLFPTVQDLNKDSRNLVATTIVRATESIDTENTSLTKAVTYTKALTGLVASDDYSYLFSAHRNQNAPEWKKTRTHTRINAALARMLTESHEIQPEVSVELEESYQELLRQIQTAGLTHSRHNSVLMSTTATSPRNSEGSQHEQPTC
jgi:hypothetical protein